MKNSEEFHTLTTNLPLRMLRTVVVEDNTAELENVLAFLAQLCPNVKVVGTAQEVAEGAELIIKTQPDLLITDIKIVGGSCYDLLERLRFNNNLHNLSIIFMTGYQDPNAIVQAFKYAAVDFLIKPFAAQELQVAVEKVAKQTEPIYNLDQLNFFLELLRAPRPQNERLAVTLVGGKIQMLELTEVLFLEAKGSMTCFYFRNETQPVVANKNLGHYVEVLQKDTRFFSISNGLLINLEYLLTYDHSEHIIKLKGHAQPLYASRQGGQRLRQHLTTHNTVLPQNTDSLSAFFKNLLGK